MAQSDNIAIKVEGVFKSFKLPHEKSGSVKSALINFGRKQKGYEKQHVLDDISFEVRKGEFFGIVGRNGSGKSTLLKLLAGIYTPDAGSIEVNGRLTPFIELGVGFNPELSGRENVFLNGALLGFNRTEMAAMYDEIVAFAELERFMDQKLKNYSSGMQVRLAFSIAIRGNTDILVLDEVLAVGDANFQKKCFDYFATVKKKKMTVVLVTHDMSAVEKFCDRGILIDKGKILVAGTPAEITQEYSDLNFELAAQSLNDKQANGSETQESHRVKVDAVIMKDGQPGNSFLAERDTQVGLRLELTSGVDIAEATVGIIIDNSGNTPIFATNTKVNKLKIALTKNVTSVLKLSVDNIFSNGEYSVSMTVKSEDGSIIYYTGDKIVRFVVGGRKHEYALTSPSYSLDITP